jgi:hypothetical protein
MPTAVVHFSSDVIYLEHWQYIGIDHFIYEGQIADKRGNGARKRQICDFLGFTRGNAARKRQIYVSVATSKMFFWLKKVFMHNKLTVGHD